MDDPNRRRRQNEPPVHQTSNPRYALQDPSQQQHQQHPHPHSHPQQRRSYGSASASASDRYRPAPINTSPSAARGMGGAGGYNSYYQEPASFSAGNMPATAMAYGSEYGADSRQQAQGFGGYNTAAATMMYNVPQPGAQTPVYDAQSFGSRQPATMQMMTPDVTSSYFGSETGGTGAQSLQQQTAQASGASANVYQQTPSMGYAGGLSNVNTMQQAPASADVSMAEDQQQQSHAYQAEPGAMEEKWGNYQRQLVSVFQEVQAGSLEPAAETLLTISTWLLSQVTDLGLNLDDQPVHGDRLKLWNDFNHSWLSMFQKQREMMESGQPPARSQSLVSKAMIKKMGNELVKLCDGIERHGLVDYHYGVWEEQITSILEICLDLYEASEEAGGSGGAR